MIDPRASVLDALIDAPRAWSEAAYLADALGWTYADALITIGELVAEGLLALWAREGKADVYTLTPLAASGLSVHLVACQRLTRTRWSRRPEPGRPDRPPATDGDDLAVDPVDPSPGPFERAAAAEAAERWRPRPGLRIGSLPKPTVLLLGCESTWWETRGKVANARPPRKTKSKNAPPVPAPMICSCCKGHRLAPTHYCLRCGRWGLDGLLAAHRRAEAAKARKADKRAG